MADTSNGIKHVASPLARRIAMQKGIDIAALLGSGPHGRIVLKDVFENQPQVGWFIASVYLICGALRLARYNCLSAMPNKQDTSGDFLGLPIPAAAGTPPELVNRMQAVCAEAIRDMLSVMDLPKIAEQLRALIVGGALLASHTLWSRQSPSPSR